MYLGLSIWKSSAITFLASLGKSSGKFLYKHGLNNTVDWSEKN